MVEQALSSLDKYDLEIKGVRKGRGFWIVNCKNGDYVLKEYRGSQERVLLQKTLTTQIMEETGVVVQEIVPNKEGELISLDGDERKYMLQTYMEGREPGRRSGPAFPYRQAGCRRLLRFHGKNL